MMVQANTLFGMQPVREVKRTQTEALLPRLFVLFNYERTKKLVPQHTAFSREEKIDKAIALFKRLIVEEKDRDMRPSREWSLEYFQAYARGPEARREFLIDEGVFNGKNFLTCPTRVKPQMEIMNISSHSHEDPIRTDILEMCYLTFSEFFVVKNLLSFPETADIITALSAKMSFLRMLRLSQPRLKHSLLLRDYIGQIFTEMKEIGGPPLISIFGPGKGEELVPFIERNISVLCFDSNQGIILKDFFIDTFKQAGLPVPEVIPIGNEKEVDAAVFATWKRLNHPPTVFLHTKIDFSQENAIPKQYLELCRVSAANYVLHEMAVKRNLFRNMAAVSKGAIVIVDGYPSCDAFDNVILPVSDRGNVVIVGHDAIISHLLSINPVEIKQIAEEAVPDFYWQSKVIGPPIPPPFFHKLQVTVIGRRI